jgi:hypothetical protein
MILVRRPEDIDKLTLNVILLVGSPIVFLLLDLNSRVLVSGWVLCVDLFFLVATTVDADVASTFVESEDVLG